MRRIIPSVSCGSNNVSFSNDEGEIITQNKDAFKGYSDFRRIDSDSKLLYEEGFNHPCDGCELRICDGCT